MEKNVGGMDRIARLIIGAVLMLVGVAGYAGMLTLAIGPVPQAMASVIVFLIGVVVLSTGITQKCMINKVIGMDTYKEPTE